MASARLTAPLCQFRVPCSARPDQMGQPGGGGRGAARHALGWGQGLCVRIWRDGRPWGRKRRIPFVWFGLSSVRKSPCKPRNRPHSIGEGARRRTEGTRLCTSSGPKGAQATLQPQAHIHACGNHALIVCTAPQQKACCTQFGQKCCRARGGCCTNKRGRALGRGGRT